MKIKYLLSILCFALFTLNVNSQELITDRPDQTESSSTILPGYVQWESGFSLESESFEASKTITTGLNSSLFRIGLTKMTELRVGYDFVKTSDYLDRMGLWEFRESDTYLDAIYVGGKIKLVEQGELIPEVAILGHLAFPRPFKDNEAENNIAPDITLAAAYPINEQMGAGVNLGLRWPGFGKGNPDIFYSAVVGISHSEKLSSFWEFYGHKLSHTTILDIRADIGLTYLIRPNFQLDISTGKGLSEVSPDFFIAAGFSWRIPE